MNHITLKEKTVSGLLWSFIDSFANQGMQFVFGINLAGILTHKEFRLFCMFNISMT